MTEIKTLLVAIIVALLFVAAATLFAGRYAITADTQGAISIDRITGAVSFCGATAEFAACRPAKERQP